MAVPPTLGVVTQRLRMDPPSPTHELRHGHPPRKGIGSRMKYFAVHLDLGSLRFVASKNPDRIKGLEIDLLIPCQDVRDIEVDRLHPQIRRHEPDDETAVSGLRQ